MEEFFINSSLTKLDLSKEYIAPTNESFFTFLKFAESLKINSSLRKLDLESNTVFFSPVQNLEGNIDFSSCFLSKISSILLINQEYGEKWLSKDFDSVYRKYCWKRKREDLIPHDHINVECLWVYWVLRHYLPKDVLLNEFWK